MRPLYLLFCALPVLAWNHSAASSYFQQDSLRRDTIRITPYFAKTPVNGLGNFVVADKDRYAFQTYAGFNVLNTLRGHVPSLNIGPNAGDAGAGLRSAASMLVIDGLPYAGASFQQFNLNSFEYENICAVSSGNATLPYGGLASDGVVFLQSKTGKDIFRPSVAFNSSVAFTPKEVSGNSTYAEELQFTSAVAYAQDYGVADLRVSYNGSYFPEIEKTRKAERGINNVRINSGIDITDRFNARVILDGIRHGATTQTPFAVPSERSESFTKNLQGNLILQYQALDWLTITSQSSLAEIDTENENRSSSLTFSREQENRRSFANLMATACQSLSEKFSLREFAGVQYEKQKIAYSEKEFRGGGISSLTWQEAEYNSRSLLAGIGLQYDKFWFTDVNYRSDRFSVFRDAGTKPGYAVSSAFVFSEAFQWRSRWLSSGKLRGSYGKTFVNYTQEYPRSIAILNNGVFNPRGFFDPMEKRMVEAGADLSFFDNRLSLSISHFHDLNAETLVFIPIPGESGLVYTTTDLGPMHIKGWETVLASSTIRKGNLSLYTKLTWATLKNYVKPLAYSGGGGLLGSLLPDWTGGVLNQLSVGNFFSTFLVDMRKGGEIYSGGFNAPSRIYDGTNVKLRDLTIGYRWPEHLVVRTQISLSARNLWTIYAKEENVEQALYTAIPRKSICLSVTVSF